MSQLEVAHQWSPIADLPADHCALAHDDLAVLRAVWQEQKAELEADDAVREFHVRLVRRLAIETGLIECLYTLDRGTTVLLVERGLDAALVPHGATNGDPEHVIRMIRDQHDAVTGLFDFVADRRELGTSYVKELHSVLTANQTHADAVDELGRPVKVPLRKGDYKQRPNNPREADGRIHEYCPPEQVASEMDRLIEMHHRHESEGVAPEVQAAWLHHRFAQIHPFQDGNGRVARTLTTLVLLKAGGFPLVVENAQRDVYIDALKDADQGELGPLVEMFARIEKKEFIRALGGAAQATQQVQRQDAVIAAMHETLEKPRRELASTWNRAKELSAGLQGMAFEKLRQLAQKLDSELQPVAPSGRPFKFFADCNNGDDKAHWFRYQVVETAKALGYFANVGSHHSWARLVLITPTRSEILLSLHGLGREFRGVIVGSVCVYEKDPNGDFVIPASNVGALTEEPFQVNYKEAGQAVADRFADWFDAAVVRGLAVARELL